MTIYSANNLPDGFYVYAYLREDGSYYYVGKGQRNRAWKPHRRSCGLNLRPKDYSRIVILAHRLTEAEAHTIESELILQYGRKDLGTGILRNITDGGEGLSNPSDETRKKIGAATSAALRGRKRPDLSAALIGLKKKPQTEQHKINSGLAKLGQKRTPEQRANISVSLKGKIHNKTVCPHCGKEGGTGAMTRYHFAKCKHK